MTNDAQEPNEDLEDRKFYLELQVKEQIEDTTAAMGLHLATWVVMPVVDVLPAWMDPSDTDAENMLMVMAEFQVGNLAFAEHILDPQQAAILALDSDMASMFEDDEIIDAMREGGDLDQLEGLLGGGHESEEDSE